MAIKLKYFFLAFLMLLLAGCASFVPDDETPDPDPFQYTNRKIFFFNKKLDEHVLKPVAKGYQAITTRPIRQGVRNFFANVHEIPTTVNEVLQGEVVDASVSLIRFGINSTIGILGIFDVANKMGLPYHRTRFGQTLQTWGVVYSPYLMLPVLGPSTVRDTVGRFVDQPLNPFFYLTGSEYKIPYYLLYGVATREALLKNDDLFGVMSFDDYIFVRNAYLQRVNARVPYEDDGDGDEFTDEFEGEFE